MKRSRPTGRRVRRLPDQRKHFSWSRVKQERLIVGDQVLVERESTRYEVHWRIDAIDAVGDLMDIGAGYDWLWRYRLQQMARTALFR